jgi:hypothetical protein
MTTQPISLNCVLDHLTPQDDPEACKAILGVIGEEFEVATPNPTQVVTAKHCRNIRPTTQISPGSSVLDVAVILSSMVNIGKEQMDLRGGI